MAGGISDFGRAAWLSALFGVTPLPSGYYIALVSDEPGEAMDGDILADLEPTGANYRRRRFGTGKGYWEVGDSFITNIVELSFGVAGTDWGDISHYALTDAPTAGNVYAWGELANPVYAQSGYSVILPAGGMVIALDALDAQIIA